MSFSMYDITVPAFLRGFASLSAILVKADAHAAATGLDPKIYLDARLAPDMLALTGQVQRASDTAKGCVVRLGAIENVSLPDTETTFPELQARIAATVALLKGISPSQLDGSEDRKVELKMRDRTVTFGGRSYAADFALPNFYFHIVTAYDVLRHKGLEISKRDYLGPM
jgi:uncharacterized protein